MSLVENYILTEEAVREYLNHLDINGILYISRPEAQIPRLVSTIKSAQKKNGGSNLDNQYFIFRRPPSEFEIDVSYLTGVLFRKSGFDEFDVQRLKTMSALLNLDVIYDGTSKQEGIFRDIIEMDQQSAAEKHRQVKLEPATDNKPYFEHFTDFTSLSVDDIKTAFSQKDRAIISLANKPVAESTLVVLLLQVIILSLMFILLPVYVKYRKSGETNDRKWKYILYFSLLGAGYIIIEICLIQKFTLFLGQPVYTMLTVISSMLLFSGIGSVLSDKIIKLSGNNIRFIFIAIAALTVAIGLFNDQIFLLFARSEIIIRVIISVLLIAPLAFTLGIPFPYGMSLIEDKRKDIVAYSWGVNGFFSVIGSISAVMLSMSYGFQFVFILSAVLYLTAMITAYSITGRLSDPLNINTKSP
jgi:hypothetical protein